MAVKRLGTNGQPVDASRKHWSSANGQNFLGYAEDDGTRPRESAAPVIASAPKRRGRPKMSKEQKAAARLARNKAKEESIQGVDVENGGALLEDRVPTKIRIPRDILEFFKSKGPGYQTKIIDVLRSFVDTAEAMAPE